MLLPAWASYGPLGIGLTLLVAGLILRYSDESDHKTESWWAWFLIGGGAILSIVGVLHLVV